ncbi:MAG: lycopene cyclase family protein [Caldilineaceae bacterium]|nr:lycopene cyclase family protein [Caldilineaceae bacterium]
MLDALVIGAGPAGLAMAATLGEAGLRVAGIAPQEPDAPWPNTYGIWVDELEPLGLTGMLGHSWHDCTVYAGDDEIPLNRSYGLLDNQRLQLHLLARGSRAHVQWQRARAAQIEHLPTHTRVTTESGQAHTARVVIDTSGHNAAFVQRPPGRRVACQAAYGIVGTFSAPPVRPGQLVLMDYRCGHLSASERREPPTFLYAMDLGDGRYFVEETSLAAAPPVPFATLERRLHRRLAHLGTAVTAVHHIEHCLFPMNLPLPDLRQPLVGFGGAASMVHPASGYLVNAVLRRAPEVARAIAQQFATGDPVPPRVARAAWQALWPASRLRKRSLYLLGLETLMRFDLRALQGFFTSFFALPQPQWAGYLGDALSTMELIYAMSGLLARAPNHVRRALIESAYHNRDLLWQALSA